MNPNRETHQKPHNRFTGSFFVAILVGLLATTGSAENWPAWRGAGGLGMTSEKNLPTKWGPEENILWRVDLPEPGNSTPIVWDEKVFLTQTVGEGKERTVMCFDRKDGTLLWQSGLEYATEEKTHPTNPFCSASPVTDGERVYAWFGSAGVVCFDFEGKQVWKTDLGVQDHEWGIGSSPVLRGDLLFINFGPGNREFLVALNKNTGKEVWRVDAPHKEEFAGKDKSGDLHGTWATPLLIENGENEGRTELIQSWSKLVIAYEPKTGKELWRCEGPGDLVYSNPIWGEGVLVSMGGYHQASVGLRPGGEGDITDSNRLWRKKKSRLRLGSGIVRNGHLYVMDMGGGAQCYTLGDRKQVWNERLRGPGDTADCWSSLTLSGDLLYTLNKSGDGFVFKAEPEFELVATNSLGEPTNSSIVVSDGDLFIRTHEGLWCVREAK